MNDAAKTPLEIARAKRVLGLRKMTGLSRREFAKRYGVAPGTLQHWEDIHGNGLTEKGAKRLIKALQTSGIYCSCEWLMQGVGPGPRFEHSHGTNMVLSINKEQELIYIEQELTLFYQHYKEAIDCIVQDDGMWPQFKINDRVAGYRYYHDAIAQCLNQECIVMTTTGDLLVRELRKSEVPQHYTLACSNPRTSVAKPIIYDVQLVSAAPVIWIRRLLQTQ
ncbi:MAG: helix-turn-helix transcriptional regulator [Gammaproteobacteria bacterium]|jgi:transcriptional regulator with XRE-family HTH domain